MPVLNKQAESENNDENDIEMSFLWSCPGVISTVTGSLCVAVGGATPRAPQIMMGSWNVCPS